MFFVVSRCARDSQRQKVYDAERDAFAGGDWESFCDRSTPLSLEACQAIVDAVFESATLREKYGATMARTAPTVVGGHGNRGRGCYRARTNEIHLPAWTRQRWYVLHECAHALTIGEQHGPKFAKCYLDLCRAYMGRHISDSLEAGYKAKRVRYKPKRAYTISDEERERRRQRARSLAAARAR